MGIFTGLFRSRDKPQNRTAGSSYSFFMGNSTAGKPVTERSAMQMTAVYSCVRILSEAVAGLPLHLYRYKEDGGKEKALDHPLYRLLHDEPNPEMSSFVFRETLMTHLLLWGNAYAQVIRNGKGEVIALYPLMPNRMTVDRDGRGQLYYKYTTSSDDAPTMQICFLPKMERFSILMASTILLLAALTVWTSFTAFPATPAGGRMSSLLLKSRLLWNALLMRVALM